MHLFVGLENRKLLMIKKLEIIYIQHTPCAVSFHQFYDSNSGSMVWRADAVEYNCFIQEDTKENARWRVVECITSILQEKDHNNTGEKKC